jgi:cytidylate kinase
MKKIPVITIDGPSGSGKGTLCLLLAQHLGWNILDSGAIYRLLAVAALQHHIQETDVQALTNLAENMQISLVIQDGIIKAFLEGKEVTKQLRTEECAQLTSKISAFASVRVALLEKQRHFKSMPGLVADGRDMGTIIFPEADLKIFLTASSEKRAERRYKQLKERGINVNLAEILAELKERDLRDTNREVAPLKPAPDSIQIDSSEYTIESVLAQMMALAREKGFSKSDVI